MSKKSNYKQHVAEESTTKENIVSVDAEVNELLASTDTQEEEQPTPEEDVEQKLADDVAREAAEESTTKENIVSVDAEVNELLASTDTQEEEQPTPEEDVEQKLADDVAREAKEAELLAELKAEEEKARLLAEAEAAKLSQPTPEPVVAGDIVTMSTVDAVLKSSSTPREKLQTIADKAVPKLSGLANKLIGYNESLKANLTPEATAAKHKDLYTTLFNIIKEEDYNTFRKQFDIVNLAYVAFAKESYNIIAQFRCHENWKWGTVELTTFQKLVVILNRLCVLETRATELKKIGIQETFHDEKLAISGTAIANIKKYYEM